MAQQRQAEQRQLLGAQPQAQGKGQLIALRREEAPHHHREAELALAMGGQEGQVVVQQEAVGGTPHRHVELARQVARAILGQQPRLDRLHQGPGVDQLLGIETRQGIAGDVARVVVARLAAGEPHRLHRRQQGGHVLQQQPAQLDVLTGGDVGRAVIAAAIDRIGQHLQLIGRDHAVGQPQAHHEAAGGHGAEEDAQPLQTNREGGFIKALPALSGQIRQAGGQLQAAELGLGLLDLAQLRGVRRQAGLRFSSSRHHGGRVIRTEIHNVAIGVSSPCRNRYRIPALPGSTPPAAIPAGGAPAVRRPSAARGRASASCWPRWAAASTPAAA